MEKERDKHTLENKQMEAGEERVSRKDGGSGAGQ